MTRSSSDGVARCRKLSPAAGSGQEPFPFEAGRAVRAGLDWLRGRTSRSGMRRGAWPSVAGVAVSVGLAVFAFGQDENVLAARRGVEIIKVTSERGGEWRAAKLIDEQITPTGWASADASLPQEIIFRLPRLARFNTLVLNAASDAPEGEWARDVEVHAADPFPTMGGWK